MWSSSLSAAVRSQGEVVSDEQLIECESQSHETSRMVGGLGESTRPGGLAGRGQAGGSGSSMRPDTPDIPNARAYEPGAGTPVGSADVGKRSSQPFVSITLSRNQVDHVTRAALGEGAAPSVSALVAGTGFHGSHARQLLGARYRELQDNRRLSRSLLAGLLVLSCFPPEGVDMGIKDISQQLELNTSTVHRYVLTLVAAGLLERDPDTRRYRLLPE
jgi:hypothetical protein